MTGPVRAQVVVVGGGPVGLAAAGCLAALGVRVVVVEQGTGPSRHPRATMVNARTMEVFRFLGVADAVRRAGVPTESSARISWVSSLAGPRIGVLELVESAEKLMRVAAQSPTLPLICPQAYVEGILADAVTARPDATLLPGRRAVGIESGDAGVRIVHEATGGGDPRVVEAEYAVLAEGVRGTLRAQAGIHPVAEPPLGRMLDVHFAADLSAWTRGRESALYWVINRHLRGVLITVDPRRGEWLLEVPALTDDVGQELFDPSCDHRQLLGHAIGAPADARILSVRTWTMATTAVDRWRDPSGRVLVAGDAAHTFPPTGGFGMNTGIQDAHNLAWKLAGVLAGWAEPGLLDTYERERRPVADANGVHSEVNARLMGASMARFAGPAADVLGATGAAGDAARAAFGPEIERQRPHFDFSGQALGFRYVPDGDPGPVVGTVVDYRPSARVGDRAPHAWLDGPAGRVSTLDLAGDAFALLTSAADAAGWRAAVTRSPGPAVRVAAVGPERGAALHDATGAVHSLYPIGAGRAVLVRPDGHVAALLGGADPGSELRQALAQAVTGSTREGVLT